MPVPQGDSEMPTKKEVKEAVRAARLAEARAREAKAVRERKKHQQAMDEAAQSKEQESLSP